MRERKASGCFCPYKTLCCGHICACWLWTLDPDTAKEQREHATGRCGLARDSQDMIDDVTTEG